MRTLVFVAALALLSSANVGTHHSIAPVFDECRRTSISGMLRDVRLVDPHSRMSLEAPGDNGQVVTWLVEMTARFNLVRNGWDDTTVVPGDRVTVSGRPARDNSHRLYARSLLTVDGAELLSASVLRDQAVEEGRQRDCGH